jgi:protein-arginine kinase activator protein McsA
MNFNCELCDYSAKTSFEFNRHTKSLKHIKNKSLDKPVVNDLIENKQIEPLPLPLAAAVVDKYGCSDCGSVFKNQTNLNRHKRTLCLKDNNANIIDLKVHDEIEKLKAVTSNTFIYNF